MTRRARSRLWSLVTDVTVLVLLISLGLAGSVLGYRALAQKADTQQRELLAAMGQSVIGAFDLQLLRAVEGLQVSSQMFSAQGVPTREQFARYGASLLG